MKFGVIILNYLAYQDTINCVNDFLNQNLNGDSLKIAIVDNFSYNESIEKLKEEFKDNENIKIARTDKNLGFANGNNYGYEMLKKYDCDFYIISNDDILIKNQSLFNWIKEEYSSNRFAVLGPDIYAPKINMHQNPNPNKFDCKYLRLKIFYYQQKLKYFFIKINPFYNKKEIYFDSGEIYKQTANDKTLHGAFQIFSKDYFEYYDEPYDKRTFLYVEEDLLKLRCKSKNLDMIYSPSFTVEHLQETATNIVNKNNNRKKILFRLKHFIKSFKIYLKELKKYYKQK